jgi:leucyl-tRNA synthetase
MHTFLIKKINKGFKKETILENYKKILISINPIIPHFSSECLKIVGEINKIEWPNYDEKQIEESLSLIVVQINGKKRGLIKTKQKVSEQELMQLIDHDEKISKYLIKADIKKKIYIKNKLINLII